ncbi:radical SAM protein [Sporomusa sp.]|uniref:radical SAM protein n=1 Tax=Sporomusa sp. TaxID=2078658 RepID=UPI002C0FB2BB|nr:radical SAM protein [Sporomusa sp.]HWR07001.1 radical SAM protein [Sporomusa sp.]
MYFRYDEPLFRPPAEANSAIIQATLGCSWNRCAFCDMYSSKKFRARSFDELKPEIETLATLYQGAKKVFLADGNAFVLSANRLVQLLEEINRQFGRVQRVSAYALPRDILSKTDDELKSIRANGLKLLYIGVETGDDELLKLIGKGETADSTVEGILKAHNAGIETSVMIINGLGGKKYSLQHAVNSAKLISRVNPKFLSTLTLSMPMGEAHFKNKFKGDYIPLTVVELFEELRTFIGLLEIDGAIYRSNHVSNNLNLSGTLSKDREMLLAQLDRAIASTPGGLYHSSPSML